jgi:hypothetical protein
VTVWSSSLAKAKRARNCLRPLQVLYSHTKKRM